MAYLPYRIGEVIIYFLWAEVPMWDSESVRCAVKALKSLDT